MKPSTSKESELTPDTSLDAPRSEDGYGKTCIYKVTGFVLILFYRLVFFSLRWIFESPNCREPAALSGRGLLEEFSEQHALANAH